VCRLWLFDELRYFQDWAGRVLAFSAVAETNQKCFHAEAIPGVPNGQYKTLQVRIHEENM